MTKRRILLLSTAGLAMLVATWLVLSLRPYRGYEGEERIVEVPQGAGGGVVASRLADAGVIRSPGFFRLLVRVTGAAGRLHAGEYRFAGPLSPLAVRHRLVSGDVLLHPVTIPEGLRMDQVFEILVLAGFGVLDEFREVAGDGKLIHDLDPDASDLEGYLYPDTYRLPRTIPEADIIRGMVERFRSVYGPEEHERARELDLSLREVVTLASLVEKEAGEVEERPLVSSVFHNRLRRGMLLQCDPTVIFALIREDAYPGRLTRAGLEFDSPYNTYLYPGLPPGPIASPGYESLQAVLHPAESDYLYFVSMNTGRHHFSESLDEHRRAVNRYQRRGRGR
jgi:peptidoglycan lytic transglycosylase G